MDFVAVTPEGEVGFGYYCDDVALKGEHFRVDCLAPSRVMRIHNKNGFRVTGTPATIEFIEYAQGRDETGAG